MLAGDWVRHPLAAHCCAVALTRAGGAGGRHWWRPRRGGTWGRVALCCLRGLPRRRCRRCVGGCGRRCHWLTARAHVRRAVRRRWRWPLLGGTRGRVALSSPRGWTSTPRERCGGALCAVGSEPLPPAPLVRVQDGATALGKASQGGHVHALAALIAAGADVNARGDVSGRCGACVASHWLSGALVSSWDGQRCSGLCAAAAGRQCARCSLLARVWTQRMRCGPPHALPFAH